MPIGIQNRNDPFVLVILKRNKEIETKCLQLAKDYLKHITITIGFVAAIILFICIFKRPATFFITLIFPILFIEYMNFIMIRKIVRESTIDEVDKIINSDKYATAYVNVEKLFSLIEMQNNIIGRFCQTDFVLKIEYITFVFYLIAAIVY